MYASIIIILLSVLLFMQIHLGHLLSHGWGGWDQVLAASNTHLTLYERVFLSQRVFFNNQPAALSLVIAIKVHGSPQLDL